VLSQLFRCSHSFSHLRTLHCHLFAQSGFFKTTVPFEAMVLLNEAHGSVGHSARLDTYKEQDMHVNHWATATRTAPMPQYVMWKALAKLKPLAEQW
jgi:hypothetical protein